ncbi:threonine--tRNA ligase [Nanoarchaeota archaeon]
MVKITFPDGIVEEFKKGVTGTEIAKSIGERLAKAALAIEVDGELKDLNSKLEKDSKIRIITFKDKEGVEIFRHSSAHIMAAAVTELFKRAKPTIGPAVEEGFYYDFEVEPFKPEDLEKIEKKMQEIIDKDLKFERTELTKDEAKKLFKDNKFKLELVNEYGKDLSSYTIGNFEDLCKGPHVPSTGYIKAITLTKQGASYWRGDSEKESLQRIYGISFPEKKELKKYLEILEEAKKRDHIKLGKEMDLYSFHEEGPGFPFWHPKGAVIYKELINYAKELNKKYGFNEVMTPVILNESLWKTSGHWDHFKEDMYFTKIDEREFAVKPMNCPGGLLIYKSRMHSYRELPIRNAEFGYVHRHELSGVLHGLFRVRSFTQDDAHVFCTEDQLEDEIIGMVEYSLEVYKAFGFEEYEWFIATKPESAMGSDKVWEKATSALENSMKKKKLEYKIKEGEGAFYGPKIEINLKDAIGRRWQLGTIQIDFSMPAKFEATYESNDGTKKTPVMIHRAILGSLERFIGIMVEHYAGKFPLWLSPNQVRILPIADRHQKYAEEVKKKLFEAGLRVEIDDRAESTSKKVRDAELQKFNYILVVGDKEGENKSVNVRTRDNQVHGEKKVDDFSKELLKEIEEKK